MPAHGHRSRSRREGGAGEAVDARTLSFLLARSLAEKKEEEETKAVRLEGGGVAPGVLGARSGALRVKEEEEKEEEEEGSQNLFLFWRRSSSTMSVVCPWAGYADSVLTQCSLRLSAGLSCQASWTGLDRNDSIHCARRRLRQWRVQGSFCWYDTPRDVVLSVVVRPMMISIMANQRDSYVARFWWTCLLCRCSVVQTAENLGFSAVAVHQSR